MLIKIKTDFNLIKSNWISWKLIVLKKGKKLKGFWKKLFLKANFSFTSLTFLLMLQLSNTKRLMTN